MIERKPTQRTPKKASKNKHPPENNYFKTNIRRKISARLSKQNYDVKSLLKIQIKILNSKCNIEKKDIYKKI